jgi:hypothetical protein
MRSIRGDSSAEAIRTLTVGVVISWPPGRRRLTDRDTRGSGPSRPMSLGRARSNACGEPAGRLTSARAVGDRAAAGETWRAAGARPRASSGACVVGVASRRTRWRSAGCSDCPRGRRRPLAIDDDRRPELDLHLVLSSDLGQPPSTRGSDAPATRPVAGSTAIRQARPSTLEDSGAGRQPREQSGPWPPRAG